MSKRGVGIVAMLWVCSLFVVATIVQAQFHAVQPLTPRVIVGPEFGFRIEGQQNGVPVGLPVIRIDGQWVPVRIGSADMQNNLPR